MGKILIENAVQGLIDYNRFISDLNYNFNYTEESDHITESQIYDFYSEDYIYTYRRDYNYYVGKPSADESLEYNGKKITFINVLENSLKDDNWCITGSDISGDNYTCFPNSIYDDNNHNGFEFDGHLFKSGNLVIYDVKSDKVYLHRLGGFEIDYNKDIEEQVDEYTNRLNHNLKQAPEAVKMLLQDLFNTMDIEIEYLDYNINKLCENMYLPFLSYKRDVIIWYIKNIKKYYKLYCECQEYGNNIETVINRINFVLGGISDIVNEEYRMIPGHHTYTEEERKLVNERSRKKIRENKDLANKNISF